MKAELTHSLENQMEMNQRCFHALLTAKDMIVLLMLDDQPYVNSSLLFADVLLSNPLLVLEKNLYE